MWSQVEGTSMTFFDLPCLSKYSFIMLIAFQSIFQVFISLEKTVIKSLLHYFVISIDFIQKLFCIFQFHRNGSADRMLLLNFCACVAGGKRKLFSHCKPIEQRDEDNSKAAVPVSGTPTSIQNSKCLLSANNWVGLDMYSCTIFVRPCTAQ